MSKYRRIIAFELRGLQSADEYGNTRDADFEEMFQAHCEVRPRFGGEAFTQSRLAGRQPVTITTRWSNEAAEVNPEYRARDVQTGEIFNIRSTANPDMRQRELEILAETGPAVAT